MQSEDISLNTNSISYDEAPVSTPRWLTLFLISVGMVAVLSMLFLGANTFISPSFDRAYQLTQALFQEADAQFDETQSLIGVAFGVSFLVYACFLYGLFRSRRWVVPILWLQFLASCMTALEITVLTNHGIVELWQWWLVALFWLVVSVIATAYRSSLSGSVRMLRLQIPCVLIFLPGIIFSLYSMVIRDIPSINDSDLEITDTQTLEGRNLYDAVEMNRTAFENVASFDDQFTDRDSSSTSTRRSIQTALDTMHDDFVVVTEAIAESEYYTCPLTQDYVDMETLICDMELLRDIGFALQTKTRYELALGNATNTASTLESLVSYSTLMYTNTEPILIEYLVSMAIKHITINTLFEILDNSASTPAYMPTLVMRIQQLDDYKQSTRALKKEYQSYKNDILNNIGSREHFYWHPNRTAADTADTMRTNIAITNASCGSYKALDTALREELAELSNEVFHWTHSFTHNAIGKTYNLVIHASLGSLKERMCEIEDKMHMLEEKLETKNASFDSDE